MLLCASAFASKQTNVWYFGANAGLDFKTNPPTPIGNSAMNTTEGCASVSDKNGTLLFYTNGISVWDKNHMLYTNGEGLKGHPSSTQSAVIVPHPGYDHKYFIFTADAGPYANPPNEGIHYSVVDILNQTVEVKNISILAVASEKIASVKHCNGKDFWVVAHEWDSKRFFSWKVTENGVEETPVISEVGSMHTGDSINYIGYMKFSPNGKKLALCISQDGINEVFDFDNTSGTLSNWIKLPDKNNPYGVSFSPDNSKLYFSTSETGQDKIYQYDLGSDADSMEIVSSQKIIYTGQASDRLGALQIGPDGHIYVALSLQIFLSVIYFPDSAGLSCYYKHRAIELTGGTSRYGLPDLVESYFNKEVIADFSYEGSCLQDSIIFLNTSSGQLYNYWDMGNDYIHEKEYSFLYKYAVQGNYDVKLIVSDGCQSDSMYKYLSIYDCTSPEIKIPEAFTPNMDGQNDYLAIINSVAINKIIKFNIYDRLGNMIFYSENMNDSWDGTYNGKKQETGTYPYQLIALTEKGEEYHQNGFITLIR